MWVESEQPSFDNEQSLMARFREGDRDAFKWIHDQMVRPLIYFAENIVYSPVDAEDIVANAFYKLFNKRAELASYDHIKRWLYVIVRNEAIDYLRKKTKDRKLCEDTIFLQSEVEANAETERVKTVIFETILKVIDKLPRQRKVVICLYFFGGKTTSEIADMLGLSTQTVLNHKTKALESIRKVLPSFLLSTVSLN
jgi:RNA polymerase sigma-70 factor (family 1)